MQKVTVDKDELLRTLEANAKTHSADFELAWEAFVIKYRANVEEILAAAKGIERGQEVKLYIDLTPPQDHSEDYARAIEMLGWELNATLTLTQREFQELVQDDWGWKGHFAASNAYYTGSESPSSGSVE